MSSIEPAKPWRLPLATVNHEPAPWVYKALVRLARVAIPVLTERHWAGRDKIPATGGALVVSNHVGNYDTLVLGEYLIWAGRWPRFLGKSEIWKVPVLGWVARKAEQIPVLRNTPNAKEALVHARQALRDGRLVAMYPEGTITADPDGWPMTARHGAAQLALSTGVPVIPVGQTGAELVLGGKHLEWHRLFSLRRRPVHVLTGDPVDLSAFAGDGEPSRETLELASVAIMDAVTALVEQLRGEHAPIDRWDMRQGRRVPQSRRPVGSE